MLRLRTRQGHTLRLTADHRVRRVSASTPFHQEAPWCAAGELAPGDRVRLNNHRHGAVWHGRHRFDEGYLIGLLIGAGALEDDGAVLSVRTRPLAVNEGHGEDGAHGVMDAALAAARRLPQPDGLQPGELSGWQKMAGDNEYRLASGALRALAIELELAPGKPRITARAEHTSSAFHRGLLRGLFDVSGCVRDNRQQGVRVALAQADLKTLEAAQRMLLRLGINTAIEREGAHAPQELVIRGDNLARYAQQIGFAEHEKRARLGRALERGTGLERERFTAVVESVSPDGEEDVYDVQVPGINTFDANGLHAHNCGEQPLPPYGSCLLGSVNLTLFVEEPFTEAARFNWERYKQVVAVFTRMLDNVVEINGLALAQQREEITRKRRHGMGFLGLGSTLSLLGIPYGSPESVAFTEEVSRALAITGWEVGLELAREKGPAPVLEEHFTVDADMLRQRPEMARTATRRAIPCPVAYSWRSTVVTCSRWRRKSPRSSTPCGTRLPLYPSQLHRADGHDLPVPRQQRQQRYRAQLRPSLLAQHHSRGPQE